MQITEELTNIDGDQDLGSYERIGFEASHTRVGQSELLLLRGREDLLHVPASTNKYLFFDHLKININ